MRLNENNKVVGRWVEYTIKDGVIYEVIAFLWRVQMMADTEKPIGNLTNLELKIKDLLSGNYEL